MGRVLRGYQRALKHGVFEAWQKPKVKSVVAVTATGGGKTVVMASMAHDLQHHRGVIEAHRGELVGQISRALAAEGMLHNIVASPAKVKTLAAEHMKLFGRCFYNPKAKWSVASVDTILRRSSADYANVEYLFQDEGHHTLKLNKWGRAAEMHPQARLALFTATPCRADGKGLGRHSDGLADAIVVGPGLRQLIDEAFLTDYTIATPHVDDLDLSDVTIDSDTGEYNDRKLKRAVKRSKKLVGSVIEKYIELASGRRAICFAADIEEGQKYVDGFLARGVPAALVHGNTPDEVRDKAVGDLDSGAIHVLVNVDLFGEGFDLPAIEVVIMARPTASFPLFAQQVGRALRLMISKLLQDMWDDFTVDQRKGHIFASAKPRALVIDHVGNFYTKFKIGDMTYSGPPDGFTSWTLEGRTRGRKRDTSDAIPLRTCLNPICGLPYERIYDACPHCGTEAPAPAGRSTPQEVDGNLLLLDPTKWEEHRREMQRIVGEPIVPYGANAIVAKAVQNAHNEKKAAHYRMRDAIALWAGSHAGVADSVNYKRFYFRFGMDVHSALTLSTNPSIELYNKVLQDIEDRKQ